MLQKAGWESGKGLGSEGQGIKAPVNRGAVTANNMGVGVAVPEEVVKNDNEFDQYRKRMMLAYKVQMYSRALACHVCLCARSAPPPTHTNTHARELTHTWCSIQPLMTFYRYLKFSHSDISTRLVGGPAMH